MSVRRHNARKQHKVVKPERKGHACTQGRRPFLRLIPKIPPSQRPLPSPAPPLPFALHMYSEPGAAGGRALTSAGPSRNTVSLRRRTLPKLLQKLTQFSPSRPQTSRRLSSQEQHWTISIYVAVPTTTRLRNTISLFSSER